MATRSITTDRLRHAAREVCSAHGRRRDGLEDGVALLAGILASGRLADATTAERAALEVLSGLHEEVSFPPHLDGALQALRDQVRLLDEDQVEAVLESLRRQERVWHVCPGVWRYRTRRHVLLLVLLAHIVAPYFQFEVLSVLHRRGLAGGHHELDALVAWMPTRVVGERERELVTAYLDLAGRVLFGRAEGQGGLRPLSADAFASWPWTRRVQWLAVQHRRWAAADGASADPVWSNPAFHAHRLEFELAHAGAFGRLAREGGPVAAAVLDRMGYRDRAPARAGWPVRTLALAGLGLAFGALVLILGAWRTRAWDDANRAVAREVITRFGLGPHDVAGANRP